MLERKEEIVVLVKVSNCSESSLRVAFNAPEISLLKKCRDIGRTKLGGEIDLGGFSTCVQGHLSYYKEKFHGLVEKPKVTDLRSYKLIRHFSSI